MRILDLQIENIRGIKSLHISPAGRNFVIYGPNGSGKSAVVDAIDFLLTGNITRLTGRGTGGITLRRHGPHIDSSPEKAVVRALVEIPTLPEPLELIRSIKHPGDLICNEEKAALLDPIIEVARRKQHILSRREILRFITAESASRAEGIQKLLNLSEGENIRRALVRVMGESDREVEAAYRNVETAKGAINATVQIDEYSDETVLDFINQNREIFGAKPTSVLSATELKKDISLAESVADEQTINVSVLERDFQNLNNMISDASQQVIGTSDSQLRSLLTSIRSDSENLRLLQKRQLLELGLSLIEETGECPLCETPWPPDELRSHIETHLSKATAAHELQKEIDKAAATLLKLINTTLPSLEKILSALESASIKDQANAIQTWSKDLKELSNLLLDPLSNYPNEAYSDEKVKRLLAPEKVDIQLGDWLVDLRAKYPKASPEQTAWDSLTRLVENLKALEIVINAEEEAVTNQTVAHVLHDDFIQARDEVLENLYTNTSSRFSDLYKHLHGPDEENFKAVIELNGAGLTLGVDFYGRGIHPPHALHSEGHQDSMGICLYLALAEKLTKGVIGFTILDDVVMSVDSTHRREVCSLLSKYFPDEQFLITTHDKTWANQLRTEGIVQKDDMIEFYKWNIDTGPYVNLESDIWARIDSFLDMNDVSNAAGLMRRGSEEFFAHLCDSIEARVKYRIDGRNDLGDLLPSAMGKYNSLLKQAKKSAQSWSQNEQLDRLIELATTTSQIYQRTLVEQWAVNATVHFNNWANLSKDDFIPVREAFQDCHALFICQDCGSILRLAKKDLIPMALRCGCGKVDWNLIGKEAA
jgi:energy-coupling factor transporter ATP-binding protein EcfA2